MKKSITDIAIIGSGPCGMFVVFEAGLLKLKCHLIDFLPYPGGQLAEIYPKKPIYDIPGHPEIMAIDLVNNLSKQIEPFHPGFTLGERVESFKQDSTGLFQLTTNRGSIIEAPVVVIAGGLGCFEPRKPEIDRLSFFEDKGVDYIIPDPEKYRDKNIVIAGGGDSALDWAIFLSNIVSGISLIHRRTEFRGAPESVSKIFELERLGKLKIYTNAEVVQLHGEHQLEAVSVSTAEETFQLDCQNFIPLFGLSPKLGPIADWGLNVDKNAICVNTLDYSTNIPSVYAIGDINTYEGKLKLILCGFHEATLMVQSAYKRIHKGKKPSFKYTTVTGISTLA